MFKFHQIAKVKRGNKKQFASNDLTRALATRTAQEDYEKEQKENKKRFFKLTKTK
jgi:hypothetical protein